MPTVQVRTVSGQVLGERDLPAELFDAPVNVPVMHQVVVAGMAAKRAGTHSTKTRAEVAGGGKKPWRQKGTGRARHGSIRSPIWVGGGISHGPKPRSYEMRVNKKMKRAALRAALTDAFKGGRLGVVHGLSFEGPRTKDAVGVLRSLELDGLVLLVIAAPDDAVEKSFSNLRQVKVGYPGNLSTYDVLYADQVLFTSEAVDALTGEPGPVFEEPAPDAAEGEGEGEDEAEEPGGSDPDQDEEPDEVEP
jgi:large subunit ribosomal protein L4